MDLVVGGSATGSNALANDDPTPECSIGSTSDAGVWYRVVGNGETLTVTTCHDGTTLDTVIQVFCDCDSLGCVGGNDDASGCDRASSFSWCSESGKSYFVIVRGFEGERGDFEISASSSGTACSPAVVCPQVGACCTNGSAFQTAGASSCTNATEDVCMNEIGGVFQGPGTSCIAGLCECVGKPVGSPCGANDGNACTVLCNPSGQCGIDCDDKNACTADSCDPEIGCQNRAIECDDSDGCTEDSCNPFSGCVFTPLNSCLRDQRLSTVKKGSLLVFPAVELRWEVPVTAGGAGEPVLVQDTILTLVNDFTKDVHIKLYFVNGDAPTDAIIDDLIEIERGHPGWNNVDCTIELTENESTYLVMSTGVGGCQRFTILDPGTPPGRPGGEIDGQRVLRGFVIAFAVDIDQNEISHNHLSGHATIVNYAQRSAWEYQAFAFQAINSSTGFWTDPTPGELSLDGFEYDLSFNTLLFDFFASGSMAMSNDNIAVMLDADLSLMPMELDLRQDSCGPVTTKAHFDIWNANEDFRSGTTRCVTCWDQTLLSAYSFENGLDNNFILADLGTDKGKARIDGVASFDCDNLFVPPNLDDAILQWLLQHDRLCEEENVPVTSPHSNDDGLVAGRVEIPDCCTYTVNDSRNVSLLGVAAKILNFSGGATGTTWAGMNLVGAGQQTGQILYDVPAGPQPAIQDEKRSSIKNDPKRINPRPSRGE